MGMQLNAYRNAVIPPLAFVNAGQYNNPTLVTHAVTLPATIVAGRLLLMVFNPTNIVTITAPAGWTSGGALINSRIGWFWKIASGSEGATVSVTCSATTSVSATVWQISGNHASQAPESSIVSAVSADPPSLTASWGAANNMFIACFSGTVITAPTPPSGYALGATLNSGANGIGCYMVGKLSALATDDPGVFSVNTNQIWTMVVRGQ